VALAICKKELCSTALITPFGTWFKTWEASSAGKAWHDENEKKSHHFFSFKLDKVRVNNNAPVRIGKDISFNQVFYSFALGDQGGSAGEGEESDTVTFAATMTVTRDVCGL
jgi:hypothetical protein